MSDTENYVGNTIHVTYKGVHFMMPGSYDKCEQNTVIEHGIMDETTLKTRSTDFMQAISEVDMDKRNYNFKLKKEM